MATAPKSQGKSSGVQRFTKIVKPNNDKREYRGLVLGNHLRVMLVSDPTTDKSAGSLSVKVGSLADPWGMQGLAHFLEHALFLTTRKYPEENFFKNFVVQYGGHTNAFTSLTETCYFFDVGPDVLEGALDRFAQFFVEPLFPRDLIERELQSVQFEFENTLTSDAHRFYRVRKVHGDPTHDFAKFETGNKNTLVINDELFKTMINFYETWYSANIMTLSVIGKETLDQLEKMVVPLFGQIVNKNVKQKRNDKHPYSADYCRKMAQIVPFRETRKLIVFFPLPDISQDSVKRDALSYLTFLLGHEGSGSLLSELKEQGYCTLMDVDNYYYSGFGFLDIEVNLTQGITRNKEIIQLLFQYIEMLKSKAPEKRLYDEIKKVNEMKFHFRDKMNPVVCVKFLCSNMHTYSFEHVLSARSLMGKFNQQEIRNILNYIEVNTLNLQVISPIFKTQNIKLMSDPIFGTEYTIQNLTEKMLTFWANSSQNQKFFLPAPNEFIPEKFELKSGGKTGIEVPELVYKSEFLRVWHLQDKTYLLPKAFYGFFFKSTLLKATPLNVNLVSLFVKLFYDYVNQKFYSADLVGISYNISFNKFGLEIVVQGFNDKLETFLLAFVEELVSFKINPKRAEIICDLYINSLKIFDTYPIGTILHSYLEVLLTPNEWTYEEMAESYKQVTNEKIMALMSIILTTCQVEVFAHGNVGKEEAIQLSEKFCQKLTKNKPPCPMNPFYLYDCNRDVQLPFGTTEFAVSNPNHENHGFLLYHQVSLQNLPQQALLELMHQLISEPYFNQIRMAEQLAYVTFVTLKVTMSGTMGLNILIQSAYSLKHLQSRVDAFLESLEDHFSKMQQDEFNKERSALITKISEKPKSMFGLSYQIWREILIGQYIFDRDARLLEYLRRIRLKDILSLYRNVLHPNSPRSRRLIITIKSDKTKEMQGKEESKEKSKGKEIQNKGENDGKSTKSNVSNFKSSESSSSSGSQNSNSSSLKNADKTKSNSSNGKMIIKVSNIRKFKCESILSPIPKIILSNI